MLDPEFTNWHKSNHSDDNGCVEIAFEAGSIGMRNSRDPNGSRLVFTQVEWDAFIKGIADGSLTPEG